MAFSVKLRAVEKPCAAACQEGITAHELAVTRARDGVHKLSERISELRLYAFPLCLTCGLSAETSRLEQYPGIQYGYRSVISHHKWEKDAVSFLSPSNSTGKRFLLFSGQMVPYLG